MRNFIAAKFFGIVLESKFRKKRLKVEKVIDALHIAPGQKIADIGAGTGLFSRRFAAACAPGGVVYALDTNPVLVGKLEKRTQRIDNLKPLLASAEDFNLPEKVDVMFICDVLHHADDKTSFFDNISKYLRDDGKVAIIDFREKWPPFHGSMKFSMDEYLGWIESAGLEVVEAHDILEQSMSSFFHICKPRDL